MNGPYISDQSLSRNIRCGTDFDPKYKDRLYSVLMCKRSLYFGSKYVPQYKKTFVFSIDVQTVFIFLIRVVDEWNFQRDNGWPERAYLYRYRYITNTRMGFSTIQQVLLHWGVPQL